MVDFVVGFEIVSRWSPLPVKNGSAVGWAPDDASGRLEPGQRVGLPLWFDPDQRTWSSFGDRLFLVTDSGRISFQGSEGECGENLIPTEVDGMVLDELSTRLGQLDVDALRQTDAVARRRAARLGRPLEQRLSLWESATCIPREVPEPGCVHSQECAPGQTCEAGTCR